MIRTTRNCKIKKIKGKEFWCNDQKLFLTHNKQKYNQIVLLSGYKKKSKMEWEIIFANHEKKV